MKTISDRIVKGKRRVTVELNDGEELVAVPKGATALLVKEEGFYRLGGQTDLIVGGHVLAEAHPIFWCSIEQRWADV